MIKVIDNIIKKEDQENIKNLLLGRHFPWFYLDNVSLEEDTYQGRPGLSHYFILDGRPSQHFKYIKNLITTAARKIKLKDLIVVQSRGFLQLPLSNNILKDDYVDSAHTDMVEKHLVFLYYVIDNEGETILYKDEKCVEIKKKVKPKQGRMLIFNGKYWHTACQPTKSVRCIINTNIRI